MLLKVTTQYALFSDAQLPHLLAGDVATLLAGSLVRTPSLGLVSHSQLSRQVEGQVFCRADIPALQSG